MQPIPLQINKPCHENWDAMTPNERGRHCASCNKTVVDLTAMPPAQAATYMTDLGKQLQSGHHVCVRAHADTNGRLLKPGARKLLLTNGLAAILAMTLSGCGDHLDSGAQNPPQQGTTQQPPTRMGAVANPHPMLGAPVPTPPRAMMGDVCEPPPATMGEPEACPTEVMGQVVEPPRELMGKVAAPAIKGEVSAPSQVE